jgi:hypothetical protein
MKKILTQVIELFNKQNIAFTWQGDTYLLIETSEYNILDIFTEAKSEIEQIDTSTYRIDLNEFPVWLYENKEHFQRFCGERNFLDKFEKGIFIKNFNDEKNVSCLSVREELEVFNSDKNEYSLAFLENIYYYHKILNTIIKNKQDRVGEIYLIEYDDEINRQFVISSKSDVGTLVIQYPSMFEEERYNCKLKLYYQQFEEFIKDAVNDEKRLLMDFFKKELFYQLSNVSRELRLYELLNNLPSIIQNSLLNYDAYSLNFSFDNFRHEFKEKKIEYFKVFRENVNNLLKHVVAFPLSISAAAIATYKMEDFSWILYIILAAFAIYTLYTAFIIKLYKRDIGELESDINAEFGQFENSRFLQKNGSIEMHINEDGQSISINEELRKDRLSLDTRIREAKRAINIYLFLIIVSNGIFMSYIFVQIISNILLPIICSGIFSALLLLFYFIKNN